MELCAVHQTAAVGSCTRCGNFLCAECRKWMAEKPFCAPCLQRLGDKPSRDAIIALLLATLGLGLWIPGMAAIALANRELNRIKRAEAPQAGEPFASLARTLGWFEVVVGALAIVVLFARGFD